MASSGMVRSFAFSVVAFCAVSVSANQNVTRRWVKTYPGPEKDWAHAVVETADKGFMVVGGSESGPHGSSDIFMLKTDSLGTQEWIEFHGGPDEDVANGVVQTADGGYALAGYTRSGGRGEDDIVFMRTDARGKVLRTTLIGDAQSERAYSLAQAPDGGFIVAGWTQSSGAGGGDAYLVKLSASGNTEWSRTYGGPQWDAAYYAVPTLDGGYALVGETSSGPHGGLDAFLMKTDATGNRQWVQSFGGSLDDAAYSLIQLPDGGFALAGRSFSLGAGEDDGFVVRTNGLGQKIWERSFGGKCSDAVYSVRASADGNLLLSGMTNSFGTSTDNSFLLMISTSGEVLWQTSFAASVSMGSAFQQTSDGEFVMAYSNPPRGNSNVVVAKFAYGSVPPSNSTTTLFQAFTCVDSLSEIGFVGHPRRTYWTINKAEGYMQSITPGNGGAVARIASPSFQASRDAGYVQVNVSAGFPTEHGLNWRDNNQFRFALCDAQGKPLYTVFFRPNRPRDIGTTFDIRLMRGDDLVIATATTDRVTPFGAGAALVDFVVEIRRNGNVVVKYDAKDGRGLLTAITTHDAVHRNFSGLQFLYRTGAKGDGSNFVVVDNVGVFEVKE